MAQQYVTLQAYLSTDNVQVKGIISQSIALNFQINFNVFIIVVIGPTVLSVHVIYRIS